MEESRSHEVMQIPQVVLMLIGDVEIPFVLNRAAGMGYDADFER